MTCPKIGDGIISWWELPFLRCHIAVIAFRDKPLHGRSFFPLLQEGYSMESSSLYPENYCPCRTRTSLLKEKGKRTPNMKGGITKHHNGNDMQETEAPTRKYPYFLHG